jgi:hypothetical protein
VAFHHQEVQEVLPRIIWAALHLVILCISHHSLRTGPSVGLVDRLLDHSHQASLALGDLEVYLPDQVCLQVLVWGCLRDRPLSQAWEFTSRPLLVL